MQTKLAENQLANSVRGSFPKTKAFKIYNWNCLTASWH
uniref:Uncharacterized protein n=1 Tax=Rhizophora mucronata TaxID=61149 RepID=A0A2P2QYX4_RHIMU